MTDFITLACPSCGGRVQVTPGSNRYICDYCGTEHLLKNPERVDLPVVESHRGLVPIPNGVEIKEGQQGLRLTRRWFSWKYIPLAFFCVAWDSFLIFWYSIAFSTRAPWIMVVFPIAHLAVGVGLTYSLLAGFLNRTILEITPVKFNVWHTPLMWSGELSVNTQEIAQLYSKEKAQRGEHGTTFVYELWAVTRDGKSHKLLSGLDSPDVPLYIEQQIEDWLQIEDHPVAGELAR